MTTMQISSDGRFYLVSYGWCYSLKHALHLTKPHEYSWMIKWPLEAFGLEVKHCHLMIYSFFLGSCWKYHGYFDHTLPWHLISSSFLSLCLFKCFMMMMMWGFFWVDLFNLLHNIRFVVWAFSCIGYVGALKWQISTMSICMIWFIKDVCVNIDRSKDQSSIEWDTYDIHFIKKRHLLLIKSSMPIGDCVST